jgi:hypothetical protein
MDAQASGTAPPDRADTEYVKGCAWWWWALLILILVIALWVVWGMFSPGGGSPTGTPGPIGPTSPVPGRMGTPGAPR